MKRWNLGKRIICLGLAVLMALQICGGTAHAATYAQVDNPDFATIPKDVIFKWIGKTRKAATISWGSYVYNECTAKGETIYIADYTDCAMGAGSYGIIRNQRGGGISEYAVYSGAKGVNQPARVKKGAKVKSVAIAGDVMTQDSSYYIRSAPKDENGVNCYGFVAVGTKLEILNANYNDEWVQIKYHNRVCYFKKSNIIQADSYLADADRFLQKYIKQAKQANLTYDGILKNYTKAITKKEFCRLAVNWYQAVGNTLPTQQKTSPYTDTKDPYVIMAYQLGILPKTQKFLPNQKVTKANYISMMTKLLKVSKGPRGTYAAVDSNVIGEYVKEISRENAIVLFYKAYLTMNTKTGYLLNGLDYAIAPVDDQTICLDVWNESRESGETIGLWDNKGSNNQKFFIECNNDLYSLKNRNSLLTLTSSKTKVIQRYKGFDSQKLTFEYNDDGTVSVKNESGLYLDIKGGKAVKGATLFFNEKTGSSTQKFVFIY